jgi:ADP-heptose:LPS heptosyltransferase
MGESHKPRAPDNQPARPRLLVLEFWGLGDLTLATTLLRAATDSYEVTLLGKPHARALLEPAFPDIRFVSYDPPWTVFRGKYHLWKWNWIELLRLLGKLRRIRFEAAVSVRDDPRDHLIMWLCNAQRRYGFPRMGSNMLLSDPIRRTDGMHHKVALWRALTSALGLSENSPPGPALDHLRYSSPLVDQVVAGIDRPIICFHAGARIPVRRWPIAYFAAVLSKLRSLFDFHLLLIPDPDGYGLELMPQADSTVPTLGLRDLVNLLGRVDLLLCNDSGPGHLAAGCGRPVISIFGPTDPGMFRPWGSQHHVVIRDLCAWRPCFDYCRYSEPYCLTKLLPEAVSQEICAHVRSLIDRGFLTRRFVEPDATRDPIPQEVGLRRLGDPV